MTTQPPTQDLPIASECAEIADTLNRKYAGFVGARHFEVETSKDSTGIHAKVTLRNRSGSFCYPVEGRLAHIDHDLGLRDAAHLLLDFIDAYFAEYFREGDVYLPIDWADYESDGITLQMRGQILNLEAERLADEWLKGESLPGQELH